MGMGMDESARVSAQAQGQPAGRAEQSRGAEQQGPRRQGHKGTRAPGHKGHTQTGLFPVAPSARGSQPLLPLLPLTAR
jgi:hypothetical protein